MSFKSKYNIPTPRYTSYPTVPFWDATPSAEEWSRLVKDCFVRTNHPSGISLYIHLPFCESLCTYCACSTRITINHKVEAAYVSALLKEWNLYLALFGSVPRIREIHLGGGTPTFFSPENLHTLLTGILNQSLVCGDHDFSFEGHPANTTAEHLQVLYDLGFRRVSFGIQDFDLKVQDVINRAQSFEQVEQVVKLARSIGYSSVNFDLVYGLPLQTAATMKDTVEKVVELKPDRIAFYSYAHVPWLKPGQRKFTEKDLPVDAEKRALYTIGLTAFKQAGYKEIGMDHFALPGDSLCAAKENNTLHRNFMGYTSNRTELLVALGASAISDSYTAFAQNEKKVEDYYEKLNNNTFPFCKGHVLSSEDLFIREQILNIMCQENTAWSVTSDHDEIIIAALADLRDAEAEGLIKITHNTLSVLPEGKPYLRNFCLAFDNRYRKNKPQKQVFSTTA